MQRLVFTGFLDRLDETLNEPPAAPVGGNNVVAFPGVRAEHPFPNPFREPRTEAERRLGNERQQRGYGQWLFKRFAALHPEHVGGYRSAFDYLEGMGAPTLGDEGAIRLHCDRPARDILILDYWAKRPLPHVCRGLIEGCLEHFGTQALCGQTLVIGSALPRYKFHVVAGGRR